jgi:hypothetical protein
MWARRAKISIWPSGQSNLSPRALPHLSRPAPRPRRDSTAVLAAAAARGSPAARRSQGTLFPFRLGPSPSAPHPSTHNTHSGRRMSHRPRVSYFYDSEGALPEGAEGPAHAPRRRREHARAKSRSSPARVPRTLTHSPSSPRLPPSRARSRQLPLWAGASSHEAAAAGRACGVRSWPVPSPPPFLPPARARAFHLCPPRRSPVPPRTPSPLPLCAGPPDEAAPRPHGAQPHRQLQPLQGDGHLRECRVWTPPPGRLFSSRLTPSLPSAQPPPLPSFLPAPSPDRPLRDDPLPL